MLPGREDQLIEFISVIAIVSWVAGFGLAAARAASRLDRTTLVWFAFGAVLGPIALLLLWVSPPGSCRSCGTPTRGWLTTCVWCGEEVSAMPADTMAMVARMSGRSMPSPAAPVRPAQKPVGPGRALQVRSTAFPTPTARISPPNPRGPTRTRLPAAARPAVAVPQPGPERNGARSRKGASAGVASTRAASRKADLPTKVLATALYVTGNKRLEPGRRYSIAVQGSRLQILGPVEFDPAAVVVDRPAQEIDASEVGGRLIISEPRNKSGLVLAFMSLAGATSDHLAERIHDAARETIQP